MKLEGKLELTWVGKNEEIKLEPRILVEDKSKSYGDPNTDNMLIHGDNLLALKALEKDFAGKIKCIYIDPPYNTGSAFEYYEDGLEHSEWLCMMKPRLEMLKKLLADDGLIFIQIDDNEQAYLKVLCDEIFGRNNFVNCIAIKMSPSSGLKRSHQNKGFIKNKEFILVYSKGNVEIKSLYDEWEKYDNHYSIFFDGTKYDSLLNILKTNFQNYKKLNYNQYLFYDEIKQFIIDNATKIFRSHDASKWALEGVSSGEILYSSESFHIIKVLNPSNNLEYEILKSKNKNTGYDRLEPLSWNIINGKIQTLRGDLWQGFEKDMGNVSKEGSVKFPASKKPERLIHDILACSTEEGDLILDSFLGSGTTVAVAHKMKRRWIGVELGNHAYTHCIPRLNSVINGEDLTGVTSAIDWQGGGGYRFYELAESLLVKNEKLPIYQINPNYTFEMMCEAICKIEGFDYKPEGSFHGKSSENRFIHVTTEFVNAEYIKTLSKELSNKQSLLIYSTKFATDLRLPDNIVVKKIPKDLLKKCKFESEVR